MRHTCPNCGFSVTRAPMWHTMDHYAVDSLSFTYTNDVEQEVAGWTAAWTARVTIARRSAEAKVQESGKEQPSLGIHSLNSCENMCRADDCPFEKKRVGKRCSYRLLRSSSVAGSSSSVSSSMAGALASVFSEAAVFASSPTAVAIAFESVVSEDDDWAGAEAAVAAFVWPAVCRATRTVSKWSDRSARATWLPPLVICMRTKRGGGGEQWGASGCEWVQMCGTNAHEFAIRCTMTIVRTYAHTDTHKTHNDDGAVASDAIRPTNGNCKFMFQEDKKLVICIDVNVYQIQVEMVIGRKRSERLHYKGFRMWQMWEESGWRKSIAINVNT